MHKSLIITNKFFYTTQQNVLTSCLEDFNNVPYHLILFHCFPRFSLRLSKFIVSKVLENRVVYFRNIFIAVKFKAHIKIGPAPPVVFSTANEFEATPLKSS